ncbi:immunoglobulin domain-containing protein [Opitutales bacterium]|nr:immunoglobulin domain-containing protein [Opitutales bacterium]
MYSLRQILILLFGVVISLQAVPPVLNYAGQVAVNGEAFEGNGLFKFALVNSDENATYWSNDGTSVNGSEPKASVSVPVNGGLYSILLGNTAQQGMGEIDPAVFAQHTDAKLRVWFSDGVNGFQQLSPDRPFASVPYAFTAGTAQTAGSATIADGSINKSMLGSDVIADLNKTVTITRDMLPQDVRDDLNKTITITRNMLPADVLSDLNRTISKSMLGSDVLADLNKSSTTPSPITLSMLAPEVTAKLDQNGSGGNTTVINPPVVGSTLALPYGQNAPAGYSLYQRGEAKALVWEEKAPVSVARYAYDGVEVLGGKIYFIGGHNGAGSKNIAERYESATNSWESLNSMSVARHGVASAVLNGKFYAIGGLNGSNNLSSVVIYDPSTESWSAGVALPSAVSHASAMTVNGKIYLIGGKNASNQKIDQVLCFDPSSNQWSTKANMPTARESMKLVWFEDRIWAIGGKDDGNYLNTVESYLPNSDSWQTEAYLLINRFHQVSWVANGRIYTGGGYNGTSYLDSVEVYDPATKQWSNAGSLPGSKYVTGTVVLNNTVYVIAGSTASGVYSNKVYAADLNASVEGVYDLYRRDGNASAGTPLVQAEVADGSVTGSKMANNTITTTQLNEQILKYLKPEISQQPQTFSVLAGSNTSFSVTAEGKYLSYQWKKDGSNVTGETNATLKITDANATQHDGNYSVVVSNEFGNVESNASEFLVINQNRITQGLVGWWPLDGNASDMSGNGNDGIIKGAIPEMDRRGVSGKAYYLDGVDDEITLGNSSILNPTNTMTLSVWFKIESWKRSPIIERYNTDSGQKAYILDAPRVNTRVLRFRAFVANNSQHTEISSSQLQLDTFYNASATYDSNNESCLFLNGVLQSRQNVSAQIQSTTSETTLGGYVFSQQNYFHGTIDDVRIYDRALSAEEVQALYNLGQ